jgi:hypothetical protein
MRLDLLTNSTVVDDAIRFIFNRSKGKEKPKPSESSNDDDNKESNDQTCTTNQAF